LEKLHRAPSGVEASGWPRKFLKTFYFLPGGIFFP
jgi:hypothetical protein